MKAVELYKIVLADQTWNWTSGDTDVVYNGDTYTPMVIGRSEVEQGAEINRANINLTVARDNPVGAIYLARTPDHHATVTLFRQESELEGSPDTETLVYWKGRISGAKAGGSQIEISCESVFTSLRRFGLRARYQRGCRHALYHRGCNLNREDFAVDVARVTAISGVNITVPEAALQADGWYIGGMIELDGVFRFVVNHVGTTLTLQRVWEDLAEAVANSGYGYNYGYFYGGLSVRIYPGCDRSRATCESKFNNLDNYGGFDWIPMRNPFDGKSII